MNPIKYLKNLSMSLGAFVALGVVACGFVFAVAAFLRCLLFAWHKGWTLFAVKPKKRQAQPSRTFNTSAAIKSASGKKCDGQTATSPESNVWAKSG